VTACGAVDPTGGLPPAEAQLSVLNALEPGVVGSLTLDGAGIGIPAVGSRIARVIPAGEHRVAVRSPEGQMLSTATFTVAEGGRRTAIIGGSAVGGTAVVVVGADTASAPVGNAAKLRLVHTVQGLPALEAWLFVPGQPTDASTRLVSPVDYGSGSTGLFPGYVERSSGNYQIRVTSLAAGALAAELDVSLRPGEVWSVVMTRGSDGELDLIPIQER
jgi:hypothetical protein